MEDVTKIKDDLESTKQLLELEVCSRSGSHSPYKATLFQVRSKSLLEKDNKKLQAEIERLKDEFQKMQDGGQPAPEIMNSILSVRKDSVSKEGRRRKSSVATVVEVAEDMAVDEEAPEKPAAPVKSEEVSQGGIVTIGFSRAASCMGGKLQNDQHIFEEGGEFWLKKYVEKNRNIRLYDSLQVIEEMEELKDEVDEARKLAEEWEAKYKEMQRQMSLLEEGTPFGKKNSTTGFEKPVLQRGLSTTSSGMLGSTFICEIHAIIKYHDLKIQVSK